MFTYPPTGIQLLMQGYYLKLSSKGDTYPFTIVRRGYLIRGGIPHPTMQKLDVDLASLLDSPAYAQVVVELANGNTYGQAIAKALDKKQNSISQQLTVLERHKLIVKGKRDKAQHFELNFVRLLEIALENYSSVLRENARPYVDAGKNPEFVQLMVELFELYFKFNARRRKEIGVSASQNLSITGLLLFSVAATHLALSELPNFRKYFRRIRGTKLAAILLAFKNEPKPIAIAAEPVLAKIQDIIMRFESKKVSFKGLPQRSELLT